MNVSKGSSIDPDHPYYFEISTESRTYALCAPSAEDLEGWLVALGAEKGVGGEAENDASLQGRWRPSLRLVRWWRCIRGG